MVYTNVLVPSAELLPILCVKYKLHYFLPAPPFRTGLYYKNCNVFENVTGNSEAVIWFGQCCQPFDNQIYKNLEGLH